MADIRASYMGVPLTSPIVVGSCSLSKRIDTIRLLEDSGAEGLVIKSLFEEQIQIENGEFENARSRYDEMFGEALSLFPKLEHGGPRAHVYWVEQARKAVKMPLFASINCVSLESWAEYARQLESTGVDGIELNFYSPALHPSVGGSDIEKRELDVFAEVRAAVKIPIAVKLHPHYTSLMNVVAAFEKAGADAFVLFNRLFLPDIDVDSEHKVANLQLSQPGDSLVSLRWVALLRDRIKADIVASTGISSGRDVVKMILAGAKAVQIVSVLYREEPRHIRKMLDELLSWMAEHGYENLAAFRSKLGQKAGDDAWSFERGQYIKAVVGFD